jgi:hypoxanthine phosphoribosyltransferase
MTKVQKITYTNLGKLIDNIALQVKQSEIQIDAIAPIFRSGGILGSILATKLNIIPIIPIQVKNNYMDQRAIRIFETPKLNINLPNNPNILLCDSKVNTGSTISESIKLLQACYPQANLHLATIIKTEIAPLNVSGINKQFVGKQVVENLKTQNSQLYIFPWEHAQEEIIEANYNI